MQKAVGLIQICTCCLGQRAKHLRQLVLYGDMAIRREEITSATYSHTQRTPLQTQASVHSCINPCVWTHKLAEVEDGTVWHSAPEPYACVAIVSNYLFIERLLNHPRVVFSLLDSVCGQKKKEGNSEKYHIQFPVWKFFFFFFFYWTKDAKDNTSGSL